MKLSRRHGKGLIPAMRILDAWRVEDVEDGGRQETCEMCAGLRVRA